MCHGMSPSSPITPFSATAATSDVVARVEPFDRLRNRLVETTHTGDRGLDPRVRVVALHGDVLQVEPVELGDGRVQVQGRGRPRVAGHLHRAWSRWLL